jgi:hypothetical protein
MDVIGFLCVSLGSSTVQLRDSLGSWRAWACSETGFNNLNWDDASGIYYWRVAFCCAFYVGDINKGMFPVYGGKCLSREAVHNWVEKFSSRTSESRRWWNGGTDMAEATVKIFLCCGVRHTGRARDKCINVGGGYGEKLIFFSRSNIMFHVLYPFVTYILTLPYIRLETFMEIRSHRNLLVRLVATILSRTWTLNSRSRLPKNVSP